MRHPTLALALALMSSLAAAVAHADGCYICSHGSTDACRDYCRYSGSDTSENRRLCQRRGCRIGGTASCPTAVNYRVCLAPPRAPAPVLAVCDAAHPHG